MKPIRTLALLVALVACLVVSSVAARAQSTGLPGVWVRTLGKVAWTLVLTPDHTARAVFTEKTDDNATNATYLRGQWHVQHDTLTLYDDEHRFVRFPYTLRGDSLVIGCPTCLYLRVTQ